jgi:hypothetical protein
MTTLRDFILTRESEIKSQIKALRAELCDLKVAKSALEPQVGALGTDSSSSAIKTIKEMIRDALKSSPVGLTSTEILIKINDIGLRHIERTSLSPQLSRMKEDGEVTLRDNFWFLAVATQVLASEVVEPQVSNIDQVHFGPDTENWDFEDNDSEVPF